MSLPIKPPFLPMEAEPAKELPVGPEWQYEPKWDGFRCLAFRDGADVQLQSKSGQPLARYFPELVAALRELKPKRFVLDGEIIIQVKGQIAFDELLMRIHPAESRIRKLSEAHPAVYAVFDLLADERGREEYQKPLKERRAKLEQFAADYLEDNKRVMLSPATAKLDAARKWLRTMGGGLDGIIAKCLTDRYRTGERAGMLKIKDLRTADCVVGGFRYGQKTKVVGSLLLGLYESDGLLHHVGFTSSIAVADRAAVTKKLEALIEPPGFTGRTPGGPSRWSNRRSDEWQPLKRKLVVEVQYDHFAGGRFRHGTKLLRWRPDKSPKQCLMAQVEKESKSPLRLLR